MAQRRTEGWPVSRIADAAGVSRRAVCTWLGRTSLENHSSRARRIASRPSDRLIEDMARLRGLRLTGAMIAHRPRLSRSTVAAWLNRLGPGRLTLVEPKPAIQRYERERAGELIHVDIKKLGRFNEIGPRIPGDAASRQPIRNIGWDFVHVAIDDDSLLACVEVLPDETGLTASGFLERAIAWRRAPTRPAPTARPRASSRPSCLNGPAQTRRRLQQDATQPSGHCSGAITTEGLMPASPGSHQLKPFSSNNERRTESRHLSVRA